MSTAQYRYSHHPPETLLLPLKPLIDRLPATLRKGGAIDSTERISIATKDLFEGISPGIRLHTLAALAPAFVTVPDNEDNPVIRISGALVASAYQLVTTRERLDPVPLPTPDKVKSPDKEKFHPSTQPATSLQIEHPKPDVTTSTPDLAKTTKKPIIKTSENPKSLSPEKTDPQADKERLAVTDPSISESKKSIEKPQKRSLTKEVLPSSKGKNSDSEEKPLASTEKSPAAPKSRKSLFGVLMHWLIAPPGDFSRPVPPASKEVAPKETSTDRPGIDLAPIKEKSIEGNKKEQQTTLPAPPSPKAPEKESASDATPTPAQTTSKALHLGVELQAEGKRILLPPKPVRTESQVQEQSTPTAKEPSIADKPLPSPSDSPSNLKSESVISSTATKSHTEKDGEKLLPIASSSDLPSPAQVAPKEGAIAPTSSENPSSLHPAQDTPQSSRAMEEIPDQESVQSLFLTEEELTIDDVVEYCTKLPGIRSSILARGSGVISSAQIPDGIDILPLTSHAMKMIRAMEGNFDQMGVGEIPAITLHSTRGLLTLFPQGDVCLLVLHTDRSFVPGVREKLIATVKALSNANLPLALENSPIHE